MANVTITIGSPSLTGKDDVELVTESFGASSFPLAATLANFMPRHDEFPFAGGFVIGHVADLQNATAQVTFPSLDDLKAFASELSQISELNGFEKAMTITADGKETTEPEPEPEPEEGEEEAGGQELEQSAKEAAQAASGTTKARAKKAAA